MALDKPESIKRCIKLDVRIDIVKQQTMSTVSSKIYQDYGMLTKEQISELEQLITDFIINKSLI